MEILELKIEDVEVEASSRGVVGFGLVALGWTIFR